MGLGAQKRNDAMVRLLGADFLKLSDPMRTRRFTTTSASVSNPPTPAELTALIAAPTEFADNTYFVVYVSDIAAMWLVMADATNNTWWLVDVSAGPAPALAVLIDGSRQLTSDWDAGSFQIRAETFQSDVATGTAPLTVASATLVSNLNADLLDGVELMAIQAEIDSDIASHAAIANAHHEPVTVSGLGLSLSTQLVTLTSSSNPGAAASILATDSAGKLTLSSTLSIDGSADEIQLIVQANATQSNTNPLIQLQDSSGTALLSINSDNQYNTFVGLNAGRVNNVSGTGSEGLYNTFLGSNAGYSNTTGGRNTASGYAALYSNTTGSYNTANGYAALNKNTTGSGNIASGYYALYSNTTGNNNTASGTNALRSNTTGFNNTASGLNALYKNTTGYQNTASGYNTLYSNTAGYNNTASGMYALYSNTTGSRNTASGLNAGRYITDGSTPNQTSNNSLYLGYNTKALADGDTNEMVFGYNTTGFGSNTAAYGNSSISKHVFQSGNVGIGTTSPAYTLDVSGTLNAGVATLTDVSVSAPSLIYNLDHDSFAGFVADEHVAHSGVVITAGAGLTGGGDISASRTLNLDTPGTLSVSSANTATGNHTHAITSASNPGAAASILATDSAGKLTLSSTLSIDGSADEIQLIVQANATQSNTNPLIQLQDSSSNVIMAIHSDDYYSVFVGSAAGQNNNITGTGSEGKFNTFVGGIAGQDNTTGYSNTAVGAGALSDNTTGYKNVAVGTNSIGGTGTAFSGNQNVSVGDVNMWVATTASENVCIGFGTASAMTTATQNTLIGAGAGQSLTTTSGNVFIGYNAGGNATGSNELYIANSNTTTPLIYGDFSTAALTINGSQSIIGNADEIQLIVKANATQANTNPLIQLQDSSGTALLSINSDNAHNTFIGLNAGRANDVTGVGIEGLYNTFLGAKAGYSNTTGSYNTASGYSALRSNTTGNQNTASGYAALYLNTTGSYNTADGLNTLFSNTTGSYNTANGYAALNKNTTGSYNTASGYAALHLNTTGSYNTAGGYNAGRYIAGGSTPNQTSNNSLYLGYNTKALADGDTNEIVIGYDTTGFGSNTAAYGNSLITDHIFQAGNVGIGTSTPSAKFHVKGASDQIQQIIQANATQTANLTEWQNSGGTAQLAIASNGRDLALDTTTGTKIGTATAQKVGFWNTTPIIQPTTAVAAATFVANTSGIADDTATFDGYSIGQIIKALRNIGLLA